MSGFIFDFIQSTKTLNEHYTGVGNLFYASVPNADEIDYQLCENYIKGYRTPRIWACVETVDGYEVWIDFGYNIMALLHNGTFVADGKNIIVGIMDYEHLVVLNKDYYNAPNYLWFNHRYKQI